METDQICNNNAVVTIVNRKLTPNHMLAPETNSVLTCQKLKHGSASLIHLRWVRRHQDKDDDYKAILQDVQLNGDPDHLAKNKPINELTTPRMSYPGRGAMLIIKGEYITTNHKACVKNVIIEPIHRKYFLEKYKKYNVTVQLNDKTPCIGKTQEEHRKP